MKWAGGKRRLLGHILPEINLSKRYFEPFIGGGAVFFALGHRDSVIADTNPEVTNCYQQIRSNLLEVLSCLRTLKNSENHYYSVREWDPSTKAERAARTLYLTRLSFNGIYRQNRQGQFNVPYGHKLHLKVADEDHLESVRQKLIGIKIRTGDFESTVHDAQKGDTVYFDPPYTVAHSNNGFVKYNARIFSWEDQRRLAAFAKKLVERGCSVIVSNADHYSIDELYKDFKRMRIERPSVIAAASGHRKPVSEALFIG
jgi:DNA adenine methylase